MALNTNNMKMSEAIELIKFELLAQEAGKVKQVPTLAGKPGIGKTESIKALAEELGYEMIVTQLSAVAPEEFSGIPDFLEAPEEFSGKYSTSGVSGAKITRWSVPELVANANYKVEKIKAAGGKGVVILFDDIHAADPALERYMFNLFLDKVIGQYKLADNVLICAAMNDSEEAGFDGFNAAVMDRLAVYAVDFDFDYWYNIMSDKLNDVIAAYLKNHQEKIIGEESTDSVTPSPRSWTELSNIINYINVKKLSNRQLRNLASARVGGAAAAELVKFKITYEKFDFENKIKLDANQIKVPDDLVEQILFSSIIRYMKTEDQAKTIIKLIELNRDKKSFVSEVVNEAITLYRHRNRQKGFSYFVNWIANCEDKEINQSFMDAIGI